MTRVLLLRHGQSTWNAEGRWQGRSDPPLSAKGLADAETAATALARAATSDAAGGWVLSHLAGAVASDLQRARHTAEVIAARLGWGPVEVFPGLRERDVGDFTGCTRDEIEARWPGLFRSGPFDPPGAEPRVAVVARAVATLHRLAERHPARAVLAVSHGALIRAVEAHLGLAEPGPPRNLAGRWIEIDGGGLMAGPPVALLEPLAVDHEPSPAAAT